MESALFSLYAVTAKGFGKLCGIAGIVLFLIGIRNPVLAFFVCPILWLIWFWTQQTNARAERSTFFKPPSEQQKTSQTRQLLLHRHFYANWVEENLASTERSLDDLFQVDTHSLYVGASRYYLRLGFSVDDEDFTVFGDDAFKHFESSLHWLRYCIWIERDGTEWAGYVGDEKDSNLAAAAGRRAEALWVLQLCNRALEARQVTDRRFYLVGSVETYANVIPVPNYGGLLLDHDTYMLLAESAVLETERPLAVV